MLHGYGASPRDHWFPWLGLELASDGIEVVTPHLPNSEKPTAGTWIEAARNAISSDPRPTVVVGHSLGTITALKALDGIGTGWSIAGLILVAGFDRPLPHIPEIDDFTRSNADYHAIRARAASRHVIISSTDDIVPPQFGRDLAGRLSAQLHLIPNAGHFLGSDGFTRLPIVAELVRESFRRTSPESR